MPKTLHRLKKRRIQPVTFCFGPVSSGKTGHAMLRAHEAAVRLRGLGDNLICHLKPAKDNRNAGMFSRMGIAEVPCERLPSTHDQAMEALRARLQDTSTPIIVLDEAQFFPLPKKGVSRAAQHLVDLLVEASHRGMIVIVAGLDGDYQGRVYPIAKALLLDTRVRKRHYAASCNVCRSSATRSQGLLDGMPAPPTMPRYIVERSNKRVGYEPRCSRCQEIPD